MKTSISKTVLCGSVLTAFVLVMGSLPENSSAQTPPAPAPAETMTASATPIASPPNFVPSSPFGQVVRLTQAGVDQSILMTYVTNSSGTFNLDSDKIIYLSDLGAPNTLVTAMMQRDQQLQQQFAANQVAQQAQPAPPTETASVASVPETAPAPPADVAAQSIAPPAPVTLNDFNDTLTPYGSWVVVNGYGRCWRPTVCVYNSSWQPYCDQGRWVYTDCGWYWSSSYAWGATFHYGRWFRDASVGWCWSPDTVWAPSWVTWRYSSSYCGWAPLPPRTAYQAGIGIVYNGGNVSVGFGFGLGANCFTFVPTQNFCSPHPRNYCVPPARIVQVYNNTTVINNYNINNHTLINRGIAVQNVATATRTTIHPVPVRQIDNSFAHGYRGQSFDRSGHIPGMNHPTSMGNGNNRPAQSPGQNRFPPPALNQNPQAGQGQFIRNPSYTQSGHNNQIATASQRPGGLPASNYNPQSAPVRPGQLETPRNYTRDSQAWQNAITQNRAATPSANYSMPAPAQRVQPQPRNYSQSQYSQHSYAAVPQQRIAPNIVASSPPSQPSGGGRSWNQNWPGH